MLTSKGVHSPMLPSEKLLLDGGEHLSPEDTTRYRSVVGALQYLFLLCQESVSVRVLPNFLHWEAVKLILHYLHESIAWACVLQSPTLI